MSTDNIKWNRQQKELVTIPSVCLVVGTFAVGLRLLSRRIFRAKIWWDDYLCLFALVLSSFPHILLLMSVPKGLGRHINELTPEEIGSILTMFYPFQLTWTSAFGVTYLSVLALYIRVFPNTWLRKWSIYSGIVAILFEVSTLGWLIFQCTPIRFFWDKSKPGHCINQSQTYVITSAMVAIMIVWLYLLPIPAVWSLQLSKGRKYGLAVTFSVGAFVVVTSVVRIVYLAKLDYSDATWSAAPVQVWSSLEVTAGVVSACIPSMMPLVMVFFGKNRPNKRTIGPSSFFSNKKNSHNKSKAGKNDFSRIHEETESANNTNTNLELSPVALNDHDDKIRLVNGIPKPTDIIITNEIHQTTNEISRDDSSSENREMKNPSIYSWGVRAPGPPKS